MSATVENYQFNLLSLKEKGQYTWNRGAYLASQAHGEHRINLCHVGKLFIEVFYDVKDNSIAKIRSFKSKCLEVYLDGIESTF